MGMEPIEVAPLNLLALILLFGFVRWVLWLVKVSRRVQAPPCSKALRPLKPKTGADCPLCQAEQGGKDVNEGVPRVLPQPWREGRSRRGRKKESVTEGYACDNRQCKYWGITDERLHARVADGTHGKYERIQDLVCQAWGGKFTVQRHTALYRLKTRSGRVAEALTFLAEGMDVSVLERVGGIAEGTLRTWLTRAGLHAEKLHAHFFQGLSFRHIQLDELWANVRQESQEVWVWVAMEVTTKLMPVIQLGRRTLERAYAVVHELRQRMQPGMPLPVFSSDGLRLYFYALTTHFGQWFMPEDGHKRVWQMAGDFIYGQVKKLQRRRRLVKVERVMLWGSFEALVSRLKAAGLSGRLNTAFIERLNLTLRQGVALLTRRTWGTAQQACELTLYVQWWRAYYHFARYHEALRVERALPRLRKGRQGACDYRSQTPAMAAGLTSRRWTVLELISYPVY
jgi:IS1 family transposase